MNIWHLMTILRRCGGKGTFLVFVAACESVCKFSFHLFPFFSIFENDFGYNHLWLEWVFLRVLPKIVSNYLAFVPFCHEGNNQVVDVDAAHIDCGHISPSRPKCVTEDSYSLKTETSFLGWVKIDALCDRLLNIL